MYYPMKGLKVTKLNIKSCRKCKFKKGTKGFAHCQFSDVSPKNDTFPLKKKYVDKDGSIKESAKACKNLYEIICEKFK